MANIYLGISGSEILLPPLTGLDGPVSNPSVEPVKQIQIAPMSNGDRRMAVIGEKRRWAYDWGLLTYAQLSPMLTLNSLKQELRLQDNYESATWYTVFIMLTFVELRNISTDSNKYFSASLRVEEL